MADLKLEKLTKPRVLITLLIATAIANFALSWLDKAVLNGTLADNGAAPGMN